MAGTFRDYAVSVGWVVAGAVLWIPAVRLESDLFGIASLVSVGVGVATLVQASRRLRSGRATAALEERVTELESQLIEIDSENESLRAEAEFDKRLRKHD